MRRGAAPVTSLSTYRAPEKKKSGGKPPHSKLRAFVPGSQVVFLLRRELVEAVAHGIELEARDFLVQVLGNDVHLRLQMLVVRAEVLGREGLVGETHVHHGGGMAFGGGKVDETSFGEQVDLAAVLHLIFVHHWAHFALAGGQLLERGNVDLHVEMAGVADNRSALHFFEMLAADHALISGHGDVNVAFLDRFSHRHYAEAVHGRFDAFHRVDFRDDHVSAEALGAHGHTAATPAVPGNDNFETSEKHVGSANYAVNRGLPCAVAIVEEVFGHRIIHGDDRILQRAVLGHGAKADYAGGGFFGSGDHVRDEVGALGQKHGDEVRAIIHGELRFVLERCAQMRIVGVVILTLDGESRNVVVAIERGRDFVLRGKWIGRAEYGISATIAERDHQVGGFAGHVQTSGNAQALERLLLDEALADLFQHGHLLSGPFDLALTSVGQPNVLYVPFFQFSGCQSLAPQFEFRSRTEWKGAPRERSVEAGPEQINFRELGPRPNFGCRSCSEASGFAKSIRAVRVLPGKSGAAAAEMAVSGRGFVNRTAEVERLNDGFGRQREIFADKRGDFFLRNRGGAKSFRHDGNGLGDADGVGQLDFRLSGEASGHYILRDVARHVASRTIHLGRILAGECAATVAAVTAVGIHDDLASSQTRVTHGSADDKAARRINVIFRFRVQHRGRNDWLDHMLGDGVAQVGVGDLLAMLRGDHHARDTLRAAVAVLNSDLRLSIRPEKINFIGFANLGEALREAVGELDGHGH